jgi:heat shock protein HslJ
MKIILTIAVFAVMIYLSACTSPDSTPKEYELNKIWVLQNLHGRMADNTVWPNGIPWMELKVNKGEFGGTTGCNGMGGTVHATADRITLYNIIATRMFCDGVDETSFLNALQTSTAWTIENDILFLWDAPGGVVNAVFKVGTVPETEVQ